MTTNEKIGRFIAELRLERGLTQAQFATKLATSQSAVNRIEKGKQNLSLETLGRISEALDKQIVSLGDKAINLRIEGGRELSGEIKLKTSKNAAVALLCASLLNHGTTRLKNIARIEEVYRMIEVLSSIGMNIRWLPGASGTGDIEIKHPGRLQLDKIDEKAARTTRSVLMMIGPLIGQFKEFGIPYSGGCELGRRTIRPHLYALEEFGVTLETARDHYEVKVRQHLPIRSVVMYEPGDTATENTLMAAAATPGKTIIKLASSNYMVQEVCFFLEKLGIKIEGIGTPTLIVLGIDKINKSITYEPSEDPVEAMTFVSAAVTTNSELTIRRVPIEFMELELLKLEKMGLKYRIFNSQKAANGYTELVDLTVEKHDGKLVAPLEKIHPLPYPGLNIDNLPYFVPIAAVARGRTLIHDWIYEDRTLMYTEIKKLNVDIELADPHRVYVTGPTRWKPADIVAPSGIRPAVMLLIAMMAAPGVSKLRNVYTINRGYEDLASRLNSLGAHITVMHDI